MSEYLAEVRETEASGEVARVYAEIRALLGLPVVNLVYRHLATVPGRLELAWAQLAPTLGSPVADRLASAAATAATVPAVERISPSELHGAGIDDRVLSATVATTLDVYERGNSLNLIALTALLEGVDGPPASAQARRPPPGTPPLPAIADLAALPGPTRSLLETMSAAIDDGPGPLLVPSLFRHLTEPPALLALVANVLQRSLRRGDLDAAARAVVEAAAVAHSQLRCRVERLEDPNTRDAIAPFLHAIPRMLVVGTTLRRAFGLDAPP